MAATKQPKTTVYLMVGYPGSGKTTASGTIQQLTGATHIWADYERRAMFGEPTHSKQESRQLYDHLNTLTDMLLQDGVNVVFDTNFGFRCDRDLLREIAQRNNAEAQVVWVQTERALARKRALHPVHAMDNKYTDTMTAARFDSIAKNLEVPAADENPTILDGTKITLEYVGKMLKLPTTPAHHKRAASR